ncbi:hypothetical protein U3516DRAFT_535315 [Neocallimastix sp. 'constans']
MINNVVLIIFMVIFYFQLADAYTYGDTLPREEVMKIKNEYFLSFYCKNDICVVVDNEYIQKFVDIPDSTGKIWHYIAYTCTDDEIKQEKCPREEIISGESLSLECKNNTDCLSDKCIDNHCVFNDEAPIVHCDDIYESSFSNGRSSFMHCGKPYRDTCKTNDECSSMDCLEEGICNMQTKGPSDTEHAGARYALFIFTFFFVGVTSIGCIMFICYRFQKMETRKY